MENAEILFMPNIESYKIQDKKYEFVDYFRDVPFRILNISQEMENTDPVMEHWHPELEIIYTYAEGAHYYIDGKPYVSTSGKLLIINSESIHKVIPPNAKPFPRKMAVVLNVDYAFIKKLIPHMDEMYFISDSGIHTEEIERIMNLFSYYAENNTKEQFLHLRLIGLFYELMYYLVENSLERKEDIFPINNQKNLERLRGIIEFVEMYYKEPIKQKDVAARFYFTKEYFSRFFKKTTGITFKEYLTRFRLKKAKEELDSTEHTILQIALNNGFSDARGFISAFKDYYQFTPFQYRKSKNKAFNFEQSAYNIE